MELHETPTISREFLVRDVDEETVILTPTGDQVLSLNPIGSFIWRQIDGAHTVQDILDILCDEYDVERTQAEADLLAFLWKLTGHGVLVTRASEPGDEESGGA
jgi:methyltransferase-like protein